jgi:hypothetical protein
MRSGRRGSTGQAPHKIRLPIRTTPVGARNEKVVEVYWNWTFFRGLLPTSDVQYIRDPALARNRDSVWALSLRATLMS